MSSSPVVGSLLTSPPAASTATPIRSSPLGDAFHLYDTTLRDGAQRQGISYSVADKIAAAELLDALGVGFVEGGWPGAMPKDTEFFARAAEGELVLHSAALVAFGATRKAGVAVGDDPQVRALLDSRAPVITVVAKSDLRHVERALRTTPAENLAMVADTVAHLVAHGRRVFLDCEHFFDGYAFDPDYGVRVLEAAITAGADVGVLCDTNGGMLPFQIEQTVREVLARTGFRIGIHCQDDTGCAVANTLAAVHAGATHAQCTANGYGERAGNADLFAVTGSLITKLDLPVLPDGGLVEMMRISHALAELANIAPDDHQAYVGSSVFAHKAGLHASAIKVGPELYNHLDPGLVGNDMHILVTEMAGRASIELKAAELGLDLSQHPEVVTAVVRTVKERESQGWSYEAADASFAVLVQREMAAAAGLEVPSPFEIQSYRVIVDGGADPRSVTGESRAEATVRVHAGSRRTIATAEGNGPVNALDSALRQALSSVLPVLDEVSLVDYKVRILGADSGTEAVTRVLVTSRRGARQWTTVGVHANVIEASWLALVDSLRYALSAS